MKERTLIKNISIVNEGQIILADILIDNGIIQKIGHLADIANSKIIDGTGKYLFPGIIDGQVHFREPGLTH
jgi:dihydroorotase